MARVLLRSTRRAGGEKRVDPRLAEVLVRRGGWEYADDSPPAPATPPPAPAPPTDYGALTNKELRDLAQERGIEGMGRANKAELVAALSASQRGSYQRRDMRAAE